MVLRREGLRRYDEKKLWDILYRRKQQTEIKTEPVFDAGGIHPFAVQKQTIAKPVMTASFPTMPRQQTKSIDNVVSPFSSPAAKQNQAVISGSYNQNSSHLTLHDGVRYFKIPIISQDGSIVKIVGEEDLEVIWLLCLTGGIHCGFEGNPGTGKTLIMEKGLGLVPQNEVYRAGLISEAALHRDCDVINDGKSVFYAFEIQKSLGRYSHTIEEFFKDITEGRASERKVTNKKGSIDHFIIYPNFMIAWTRALSNEYDLSPELRRRFLTVTTSMDVEHVKETNAITYEFCHKIDFKEDENKRLEQRLKEHIFAVKSIDNLFYFDPFADYLVDVIPNTEKSVSYNAFWLKLLRASAKFHLPDRMKFKHGNRTYVAIELQDHYIVHEVFGKHFKEALKINATDEDKRFIEQDRPFDWEKCLRTGLNIMRNHPDTSILRRAMPDFPDKWYEKQIENSALYTTDFRTGNKVKIVDAPLEAI